jgi:hypothetical protein
MTRLDKKNRTCTRCGYTCATPQKLQQHLNRKNPCKPQNSDPEQVSMPEIIHNPELSSKNHNDRKPGESVKQWGSRLQKRYKEITYENYDQPKNLKECEQLYNDLIQIDPESDMSQEKKNASYNESAEEEFLRLSNITGDNEENVIFREQQLGSALKRRAVAVHNAKVPRYHPDNGSDARKMLESQRKPFRGLLEKEFDKRGQFKFSLCSLGKFLIDDKPGNEKKNSTRRDWLRNKQIIVYNRSEIDNYLSDAFEQILYQVEERGGKSNV